MQTSTSPAESSNLLSALEALRSPGNLILVAVAAILALLVLALAMTAIAHGGLANTFGLLLLVLAWLVGEAGYCGVTLRQLQQWLDTVANVRLHGTTQRIVAEAFAAERPELQALPAMPFDALLKLERRVSHDGFTSVGGNYYSVPDRTRRVVEIHQLPDVIRVLDEGRLVAVHPVLEGRRQYRIDRRHRTGRPAPRTQDRSMTMIGRIGDHVPLRSLAVYEAIGASLAISGRNH